MSFSIGIIGLPNVGKSTLFQALTKKKVDASNYPFCTIDPNVGIVTVPDERLSSLAELSKSKRIIPTAIEFVDIAGLVKGASKGEGLGNKFLQNIREVDAIAEVVRMFDHPDITHVHGKIDPEHDKAVIHLELILSDLEVSEKRLERVISQLKGPGTKELKAEHGLLTKIVNHLREEKMLNSLELDRDEQNLIRQYNLLTIKPLMYIYNLAEDELSKAETLPENAVGICAKLESELAELPEEELPSYLEQLGLSDTGLNKLIKKSYSLLNLITFLTTGPEETRAWTISNGMTAPEAAGKIHSDFQEKFIRAETVNWKALVDAGSWTAAKDLGKIKTEGKDYVVNDGDVMIFHHS